MVLLLLRILALVLRSLVRVLPVRGRAAYRVHLLATKYGVLLCTEPKDQVLACRHASKVVNIEDTDIVSSVSTTSTASLRAVQVLATPAI